jgi:hypothetical protein
MAVIVFVVVVVVAAPSLGVAVAAPRKHVGTTALLVE